jgi:hypothetical protein
VKAFAFTPREILIDDATTLDFSGSGCILLLPWRGHCSSMEGLGVGVLGGEQPGKVLPQGIAAQGVQIQIFLQVQA